MAGMAREEHDREDLLREATALVERVELRTASEGAPVVIGFRRDGCASVYFGGDPVYHFNTRNALRRAFVDGQLWKADRRQLVAMHRERTGTTVELRSARLSDDLQTKALNDLSERVERLALDLKDAGRHEVTGCQPPDYDVLGRVRTWLESLPIGAIVVAVEPHAK